MAGGHEHHLQPGDCRRGCKFILIQSRSGA
jgi:hypothetical protein